MDYGIYRTTNPTLANGEQAPMALTSRGALLASIVDNAGNPATLGGTQEVITLVANSAATAAKTAYGGDYLIAAAASNWNSASVQVQYLDADGTTWTNLGAARTANAAPTGVGLGSNAQVRAVITGTPTGLFLTLSRIP